MGAFVLCKQGQHKDHIDITTTEVLGNPGGIVAKRSMVHVNARNDKASKDLWIGLKIERRQEVKFLKVEGRTWITGRTSANAEAQKQFKRMFPPKPGEKWVAYLIDCVNIPRTFTFESELRLSRHVVDHPDAQSVAIVVCYAPAAGISISQTDVLLGHSLIQAPPPNRKPVRPRKIQR